MTAFPQFSVGRRAFVFLGESNFVLHETASAYNPHEAQQLADEQARAAARDPEIQKKLVSAFASKVIGLSPVPDLVVREVVLGENRITYLDQKAAEVLIARVLLICALFRLTFLYS